VRHGRHRVSALSSVLGVGESLETNELNQEITNCHRLYVSVPSRASAQPCILDICGHDEPICAGMSAHSTATKVTGI
jgi:hypothetical protein